jgi:hypothetical protein
MRGLASGEILGRDVRRGDVLSAIEGPKVPVSDVVVLDEAATYERLKGWAMTTIRPWALKVPGLPWTVRALKHLLLARSQ